MEKAAREAGVLDEDETIEEVAWTRSAYPLGKGLTLTLATPHALLATQRKLYGIKRGAFRASDMKVVLELAIEDSQVEKHGADLKVGPRGERSTWVFPLIPYFSGGKKLMAYVESRAQGAEGSNTS